MVLTSISAPGFFKSLSDESNISAHSPAQSVLWTSSEQVCGHCLSSCTVLKYWLENEKQEVGKPYATQQSAEMLLSPLRL